MLTKSTQSKNENQFSINKCYRGYNRKEYKSNMRPAVLLDGNIHTHVDESAACQMKTSQVSLSHEIELYFQTHHE
jgi:hypothetical protein